MRVVLQQKFFLVLIFLFILISPSFAQIKEEKEIIKEEDQEYVFEEDSAFSYRPEAKVKDQEGKVGIMNVENEFSYTHKFFERLPVKFSLQHSYISIENSTLVKLPAHLVGLGFGVETTLPFFGFRETYLRLELNPSVYSDDYGFESSAFRIPMRYFIIHKPNQALILIAGVGVCPDALMPVYPILGFIYKPNEKITFNIIPERPNITYSLNKKLDCFVEYSGVLNGEYEVNKDNYKNTLLNFDENSAGVGLAYKFNKSVRTSLGVGGVFKRKIQYEDSLGKVNLKSGMYSEFRFEMAM